MKAPLAVLAALAVAVVAAVVYLARDDAAGARTGADRPTATFRSRAGAPAEPAGPGVFRVGAGVQRIEVEGPTLVETPAGPVELDPGEYDLRVDGADVTVTVHRGRAVFRGEGAPRVAVKGGVLSVRATRAAPAPKAEAPPSGPTTTVTGHVVDGARQPIAGARIWAGAQRAAEGRIAATTDADGRYRAEGVAETFVGARADGRAPSDLRRIEPATRPVFEMDFVLRDAGGALRVEVRDGDGAAVTGAVVSVGGNFRNLPAPERSPEGYPLAPVGPRRLTTDSTGQASALDLPPGWNALQVVATGFAPYYSYGRLSPAVEETRIITLERGVIVHGVVRDESGALLPGVRIGFWQAGSGRQIEVLGATTDQRGEYRVELVPTRRLRVFARAADGRWTSAWLVLTSGETKRWDAVLPSPYEIACTIVYADDGTPVVGARVRCRRTRIVGEPGPADVITDESGRFRFAPVDDSGHDLSIWLPGARTLAPTKRVWVSPRDLLANPRKIEMPRQGEQPGFLAGTVVLPDGSPGAGAQLTVWPDGEFGWAARDRAAADGTFRLGPLRPGGHRLEVHVDGQPTLHLSVSVEPDETHEFGVLKFPAGGRIRARIVGADGAPVHRSYVLVATLDQRIQYSVKPDTDGFSISEDLAPGRYLVYGGALGLSEEVDVRAGETTEVELKLPPMGKLAVTFLRADGTAPRELSYEVRDDAGRRVVYGTLDADTNRLDVTLAAGRYTVTGTDERGQKAEAVMIAAADGETAQTLTLR